MDIAHEYPTSGSLPVIGEDHRWRRTMSGEQTTMMRAASFGSMQHLEMWEDPMTRDGEETDLPEHAVLVGLRNKIRANVGETGQLLHPLQVRRRFHSSDVVPSTGSFHPPRGEPDSPTKALRQWLASSGPAVSPAQLRQHRRTHSTDLTLKYRRQNEHPTRRSFEGVRPFHNVIAEEILHDDSGQDASEHDDNEDDFEDHDSEQDENDHEPSVRPRRTGSEDSNGSGASESSFFSNPVVRSYESAPHEDPPSVEKLLNLQKLYQEGFITVTEYKNRRLQLVDEITISKSNKTINRTTDLIQTSLPVIHREPPDFTVLRERDAIKHVFDSEKRKWTSSRIKVKIDPQPFAKGGLRQVFHLQDLSVIPRLGPDGRPVSYVAKIAIDVDEDPDTYFRDVEMQAVASKFAKLYNSYNPPRRVEFLDAWILQLIPADSGGEDIDNLTMRGTICGVEPYIAGEYHKHNNNYGYVSDLERNTPQAFSHFTYEASGQQMLIVDIQGVSDHYTDPQIHTRSGKEFGKGNLSTRGFERFLESHRCNPICRYLKLPLSNPKDDVSHYDETQNGSKNDGRGTVPAQTYMSQPSIRVRRVDSELCHYYGDSKAFKQYQAKHHHHDSSDDTTSTFLFTSLKEQRHCSSFCGVGLCTIS